MTLLLSLEEYTRLAKAILGKWVKKTGFTPRDYDELIHGLVYVLIKSDQSYDVDKANGRPLYKYRVNNCLKFIKTYSRRASKRKFRCLSNFKDLEQNSSPEDTPDHLDHSSYIGYLKNNSHLTHLQKEHVELYLMGINTRGRAEHFGTSPANADQILRKVVQKMKVLVDNKP